MTTRRDFLTAAVGSTALIGTAAGVPEFLLGACHPEIARKSDRILVVIQLSGGNDGINTVIPYGDDAYYRNRFTLAVGRNAVKKIDDYCGLHPSMTGMSELLEDSRLAVIQGIGYPNPNRSHFESMDLWHTAHRANEQTPTGWLGRYFDLGGIRGTDIPGLHFGSEKRPLALAAEKTQIPTLRNLDDFRLRLGSRQQLKRLIQENVNVKRDASNELLTFVQSNTISAIQTSSRVEEVLGKYQSKTRYPQTGLGRKLAMVAQLIGSNLKTNVYYVTLDGFDTHSNQAAAHAGLLGQLSDALKAFMDDLKVQGNDERTLAFVYSEFGRRVRENASAGTDHGAAAPAFLAGGSVKPGTHGKYPSLTDLLQDDLKHNVDYREVYATILEKWFSTDRKAIIGKQFKTLDLLKS